MFSKYTPVLWRTLEDALEAQDYEKQGLEPILVRDDEGYLVCIGATMRFVFPETDAA
jgi:hypothetical protein